MISVKCASCLLNVDLFETVRVTMRDIKGYVCESCYPHVLQQHGLRSTPSAPVEEEDEPPAFTEPERGSEGRYAKRKTKVPWVQHTMWWVIHNCVSHPLIGVLPFRPFFRFHDWTSVKMHAR